MARFAAIGLLALLSGCSSPCDLAPESLPWSTEERLAIEMARDNWATFAGRRVAEDVAVVRAAPDSEVVGSVQDDGDPLAGFYWGSHCAVVLIRERVIGDADIMGISYGEALGRLTMHEFGHILGGVHSEDPRSVMADPASGPCILASEFTTICNGECADICWETNERIH